MKTAKRPIAGCLSDAACSPSSPVASRPATGIDVLRVWALRPEPMV
jgi:hypothetical protein